MVKFTTASGAAYEYDEEKERFRRNGEEWQDGWTEGVVLGAPVCFLYDDVSRDNVLLQTITTRVVSIDG